jgi:hypothetical protein
VREKTTREILQLEKGVVFEIISNKSEGGEAQRNKSRSKNNTQ